MGLPERQSLLFQIVSKKVKVENFGGTPGSLTVGERESLLLQCAPSQGPENLMLLLTGFQPELAGSAR